MGAELDIVKVIQSIRTSEFLQTSHLQTHQKYFVNKFKDYHLKYPQDFDKVQQDEQEISWLTETGEYGSN